MTNWEKYNTEIIALIWSMIGESDLCETCPANEGCDGHLSKTCAKYFNKWLNADATEKDCRKIRCCTCRHNTGRCEQWGRCKNTHEEVDHAED